ncbi:MAG: vWA domain-containing protein [Thermoflexibacteraceae bacterium]
MSNVLHTTTTANNSCWFYENPPKEFFVYLSAKGMKAPKKTQRPPLNIALVIDRSGSMDGEKLNYTKKAVDFVINNVESTDYMALIQYDDKVNVLSPSELVQDKKALHQKVAQIQSGGSTNLSGGMLEGYSQVKHTKTGGSSLTKQILSLLQPSPNSKEKEGLINRVLLLSDGLANVGITDLAQLQQIAQKKFREDNIGLSTFGVGTDFNEELMTNLAEYGGANYYFIGKPDEIPQIFAKELAGLLAVVAQNTQVSIEFPAEYLKLTKVYGYPSQSSNGKVQINLNDIFSEEEKAVLIGFEVLSLPTTPFEIKVHWSFDDVIEQMDKVRTSQTLHFAPTPHSEEVLQHINKTVIEQVLLFTANDKFEEVLKDMDNRNYDVAKEKLSALISYLEANFALVQPNEELQKQYENMKNYLNNIDTMSTMAADEYLYEQKFSKMANYSIRKKRS